MKEIIYLDHIMVNSLLAQQNQGLAQKLVQSFETGNSETEGNEKVNTTEGTIGASILGATLSESNASNNEKTTSNNNSETKEIILNDFVLDLLVNTLNIKQNNLVDGDIVLTKGKPRIYNFSRLKSIMAREVVGIFNDNSTNNDNIRKNITELEKLRKNSTNKSDINKKIGELKAQLKPINDSFYENFDSVYKFGDIGDKLYPNSALVKVGDYISICPKENFRVNEATLSLYNEKSALINCLGIIIYQRGKEYVQKDEDGEIIQLESEVIAASAPTMMMDILLSNFGLSSENDYMIKPIAIYYDMD